MALDSDSSLPEEKFCSAQQSFGKDKERRHKATRGSRTSSRRFLIIRRLGDQAGSGFSSYNRRKDYAFEFCIIAAASDWTSASLCAVFRRGLNYVSSMDMLILLPISLDNLEQDYLPCSSTFSH